MSLASSRWCGESLRRLSSSSGLHCGLLMATIVWTFAYLRRMRARAQCDSQLRIDAMRQSLGSDILPFEASVYPSDALSLVAALAASLWVAACASAASGGGVAVPRDVGQVVGEVDACPVTGAWAAGAPASRPRVVRCVLPRYPDDLRRSGVEGKVVVRVAVDSAGRPDSTSLQVISASTPALAAAASRSVPHLRFAPAGAGEARPVVVEMPYTFTVTP